MRRANQTERDAAWGNARNSRASFIAVETRQSGCTLGEAALKWAKANPIDAKLLGMSADFFETRLECRNGMPVIPEEPKQAERGTVQLDWEAARLLAVDMSDLDLADCIAGVLAELSALDQQDRDLNTNKGSVARDQLSVWRFEIERRRTDKACRACGRPL